VKKQELVVKTVRIGPYLVITSAVWEPARPDQRHSRKGSYRIACRALLCDRTFTVQAETDIECVQHVDESGFAEAALAEVARLIKRDHDLKLQPFAESRVHNRIFEVLLAQGRRDATAEAFRRYMGGNPCLQLWLAYRETTATEDGALRVVAEGENDGWPLANAMCIPPAEVTRIAAWIDENTRRIPILPVERPHEQSEAPTTLHRDGSVTLWNVYTSSWLRTTRPEDSVLASLRTDERELVMEHLKLR